MALLATNVRAYRNLKSDEYTTQQNLQRVVISQIQAYGFCTRYLANGETKDMTGDDWKYFSQFTNSSDRSEDDLGAAAKKFGFKGGGGILSSGKKEAYANMKFLMDDVEIKSADLNYKRSNFREKFRCSRWQPHSKWRR